MKLCLCHGSNKLALDVPLESQQDLTIGQLKELIEKETGVPTQQQKLIVSGRSLWADDQPLATINLKPLDKIMLLGKPPPVDVELKRALETLSKIENDDLRKISNRLNGLSGQIDGVVKGFLGKERHQKGIDQLKKQLKSICEDCMRTLETMDAMVLSEKRFEYAKLKRKMLIDTIQEILKVYDRQVDRLDDHEKALQQSTNA